MLLVSGAWCARVTTDARAQEDMLTQIEALNFRCLRYVRQPLAPFHVPGDHRSWEKRSRSQRPIPGATTMGRARSPHPESRSFCLIRASISSRSEPVRPHRSALRS